MSKEFKRKECMNFGEYAYRVGNDRFTKKVKSRTLEFLQWNKCPPKARNNC